MSTGARPAPNLHLAFVPHPQAPCSLTMLRFLVDNRRHELIRAKYAQGKDPRALHWTWLAECVLSIKAELEYVVVVIPDHAAG